MTITLVPSQIFQDTDDFWPSGTAAAAQSLPAPATAGNLIVVAVRVGDGAGTGQVTSITDDGSTSYALVRRQAHTGGGVYVEIWRGIAAGANAGQNVVVNISAAAPSADNIIAIVEFAGTGATQDGLSTNGASTDSPATSHDSGSVTPGTADNVVFAISSGAGRVWTNDSDFTNVVHNNRSLISYKIQSSNTSQSFTATSDSGGYCTLAIAAFKGGTPPSITDVDTDEIVLDGQMNVVATGTGLTGATFALIDGAIESPQSATINSATSATLTIALGDCRYGTRTLRAVTSGGSGDISITVDPPVGKSYVVLTSVNTTAANRLTADPDLAIGDMVEISNVVGASVSDVTINLDGTFDVTASVTAFTVRINDGTGWGSAAVQTIEDPGASEEDRGLLRNLLRPLTRPIPRTLY